MMSAFTSEKNSWSVSSCTISATVTGVCPKGARLYHSKQLGGLALEGLPPPEGLPMEGLPPKDYPSEGLPPQKDYPLKELSPGSTTPRGTTPQKDYPPGSTNTPSPPPLPPPPQSGLVRIQIILKFYGRQFVKSAYSICFGRSQKGYQLLLLQLTSTSRRTVDFELSLAALYLSEYIVGFYTRLIEVL